MARQKVTTQRNANRRQEKHMEVPRENTLRPPQMQLTKQGGKKSLRLKGAVQHQEGN